MAKFGEGSELLKCSFCGKSQKQVKKLIAGPGVYICNECIEVCSNEILEKELAEEGQAEIGQSFGEGAHHPHPGGNPRAFLDELRRSVRTTPKKVLSVAVYNHYQRLRQDQNLAQEELARTSRSSQVQHPSSSAPPVPEKRFSPSTLARDARCPLLPSSDATTH